MLLQIYLSSVRNVPYSRAQTVSKYAKLLDKSKTLHLASRDFELEFEH